jgi:ubiquinone/menaquinone biosynthesis C-methylase UbiE
MAAFQSPDEATASTSTSAPPPPPSAKLQPDWTGATLLSRAVNAAIAFPPLFAVMKLGARAAIKGTAEKRGIPWADNVAALGASEVYQIRSELEDATLAFPSYYTRPFHGYDDGNLNWKAAFEVEPATDAMALRVWKAETALSPADAQRRLRGGIFAAVRAFSERHAARAPQDVLDVGCSVGVSSRWLAGEFPGAQVTGLDLSPHFLAVAELRERQQGGGAGRRRRIKYVHANMEATGLPAASFDLVTVQFVIHECPAAVTAALVRECARLLRPGGVVAFTDNNPRSPVIQGLPPVLFTLMKSTEPWSDEYYAFDLEASMREAGLKGVVTEESDPRHRTVMGYV